MGKRSLVRPGPVRNARVRGHGTHDQPAGIWSDDSSPTFCLAEALADGFTTEKLATNCLRWWRDGWWTAHCHVFDNGVTTAGGLRRLEGGVPATGSGMSGGRDNGNGALMRILHLYLTHEPGREKAGYGLVREVAGVTHGHARSAVASWLCLTVAHQPRGGRSPAQAYGHLCRNGHDMLRRLGVDGDEAPHSRPPLRGDLAQWRKDQVRSGGHVVHTFEAAPWCLLCHDTHAATVLAAVNLGEDTDTAAAVTGGGLAGLCYGEASFPADWLTALAGRADIKALTARLTPEVTG